MLSEILKKKSKVINVTADSYLFCNGGSMGTEQVVVHFKMVAFQG